MAGCRATGRGSRIVVVLNTGLRVKPQKSCVTYKHLIKEPRSQNQRVLPCILGNQWSMEDMGVRDRMDTAKNSRGGSKNFTGAPVNHRQNLSYSNIL